MLFRSRCQKAFTRWSSIVRRQRNVLGTSTGLRRILRK